MLEIDLPEGLRTATQRDWRQLGDITAEAFAEDPVNRWVFGNPRAIQSAFRVLAREIYAPHGQCFLYGTKGAAMWMESSEGANLSRWGVMNLIAGLARHGSKGALKRATAAGEIMAAKHPKAPHMYLFTIGAIASARGQGVGKALLAPVLAACDASGTAVYLENSNPANHGFYRAHGFERMEIFACGDGGPPLEAMWRTPHNLALALECS